MLNHHHAPIPLFLQQLAELHILCFCAEEKEYYKYASDREGRQRRKGRARGCSFWPRFNDNNANINQKGLEMRLCMGLYEE